MKHAILGPGGVGGLIGGALARAGHPVILIVRPETLAAYPRHLTVESAVLGTFAAPVRPVATLEEPVDVLWVTVKATHLDVALRAAPAARLGGAIVVPLLNGVDHLARLRAVYGDAQVIAGTIRTESERVAPGHVVHRMWHVPLPADGTPLASSAPHPVELAARPRPLARRGHRRRAKRGGRAVPGARRRALAAVEQASELSIRGPSGGRRGHGRRGARGPSPARPDG